MFHSFSCFGIDGIYASVARKCPALAESKSHLSVTIGMPQAIEVRSFGVLVRSLSLTLV